MDTWAASEGRMEMVVLALALEPYCNHPLDTRVAFEEVVVVAWGKHLGDTSQEHRAWREAAAPFGEPAYAVVDLLTWKIMTPPKLMPLKL